MKWFDSFMSMLYSKLPNIFALRHTHLRCANSMAFEKSPLTWMVWEWAGHFSYEIDIGLDSLMSQSPRSPKHGESTLILQSFYSSASTKLLSLLLFVNGADSIQNVDYEHQTIPNHHLHQLLPFKTTFDDSITRNSYRPSWKWLLTPKPCICN